MHSPVYMYSPAQHLKQYSIVNLMEDKINPKPTLYDMQWEQCFALMYITYLMVAENMQDIHHFTEQIA